MRIDRLPFAGMAALFGGRHAFSSRLPRGAQGVSRITPKTSRRLPERAPLLGCRIMHEVVVRKRIAGGRQAVWDVYTDHVSWSRWAGIGGVRLAREGQPV